MACPAKRPKKLNGSIHWKRIVPAKRILTPAPAKIPKWSLVHGAEKLYFLFLFIPDVMSCRAPRGQRNEQNTLPHIIVSPIIIRNPEAATAGPLIKFINEGPGCKKRSALLKVCGIIS